MRGASFELLDSRSMQMLWTNKEPVIAFIHTDSSPSIPCIKQFGRSEKGLDIAGTGTTSTTRLQVRYTLKNKTSVYWITRQTRRAGQLMFDTTPAPGYGEGWTTKNKQDGEERHLKSPSIG